MQLYGLYNREGEPDDLMLFLAIKIYESMNYKCKASQMSLVRNWHNVIQLITSMVTAKHMSR